METAPPAIVFCRRCLYCLRGLPSQALCPECGHPFDLTDPKTFTRRPRARLWWRRARWVVYPLIVLAVVVGAPAGWLWFGWHREQSALRWTRAHSGVTWRPQVIVTPIGPAWLRPPLGRFAYLLDRTQAVTILYVAKGQSPADCPLKRFGYLKELCICGPGLNAQWTRFIATQTQLEKLSLDQPLSDDAVAELAPLTNLRELNLRGEQITDASLKTLAQFKQLEHLQLWYTSVHGPGLSHLAGLPKLTWLSLEASWVDDPAVAYVTDLKALTYLSLSSTRVTKSGIGKFRSALPGAHVEWSAYSVWTQRGVWVEP